MFLDLVYCFVYYYVCLSARNSDKRTWKEKEKRVGYMQPTPTLVRCTGLSGGAPDIVRCARLVRVNSPLSGFDGGVRLKFTGPSGGAPDCPVSHPRWTRRSRENDQRRAAKIHRTIRCANGPGAATVDCARFGRQSRTGHATVAVRWRTGLSGAPLDRRQGWPSKFASNGS
jgi:hypothetical protein